MSAAEKLPDEVHKSAPFLARVARVEFLRGLDAVLPAIEKRTTIPILGCVRIEAVGRERLRLSGSNLDQHISIEIDAEVAEGVAVVPVHSLRTIVRGMWDTDLVFSTNDEGSTRRIDLTCGPVTAGLFSFSETDWPALSLRDELGKAVFPEGLLHWLFSGVAFAISTEETRYYLNGIYLHFREKKVVTVATDGHRLASREAAAVDIIPGKRPGVIVPRTVLPAVTSLAKGREVEVRLFGTILDDSYAVFQIQFIAGDVTITSKLIDGTYPDWERVVPANRGGYVSVRRADILRALRVVPRAERWRAIAFTVAPETGLELTFTHPDMGFVRQKVEAQFRNAMPMEIGLNGDYLASIMSAISAIGEDRVRIHFLDPGSPVIFTADSDEFDAEFALQMPMRV